MASTHRIEITDRQCWGLLAVAMVASAALILYLNRGTVFFIDELQRFTEMSSLTPRDVIEPVNGHLGATSHIYFRGLLETFGADYLAFRLLHVAVLLLAAGLFYSLVKRWIGALPALAPTVVLLFLGSAWTHVATPLGVSVIFTVAMGLGALLALERDDTVGDVVATVLLCVALATFSIALAFCVGVAISVLMRRDRWSRTWVFLIPVGLYAAWWLWALSEPGSSEGAARASNVFLIPNYIAESAAAAAAGATGLHVFDLGVNPWYAFGRPLAAGAAVVLGARLWSGSVPRSVWVALGIVLTLWTLGALVVGVARGPEATRYVFPAVVGVLLVATAAARGARFSSLGLGVLFAAAAVAVAANTALLIEGARTFRTQYSPAVRADLAMVELARDRVNPGFNPVDDVEQMTYNPLTSSDYLEAVDRYGSPAFTPAEVAAQGEGTRQNADKVLAHALGVRLTPSAGDSGIGCRTVGGEDSAGGRIAFELPPGGAELRIRGSGPSTVDVGRFAAIPSVRVGSVIPGEWAKLRVPTDAASAPWRAAVKASSIRTCAIEGGGTS